MYTWLTKTGIPRKNAQYTCISFLLMMQLTYRSNLHLSSYLKAKRLLIGV